jgi:hypothetical protein
VNLPLFSVRQIRVAESDITYLVSLDISEIFKLPEKSMQLKPTLTMMAEQSLTQQDAVKQKSTPLKNEMKIFWGRRSEAISVE